MYNILLVDDEKPALQYLAAIVRKYLPGFEVGGMLQSGEEALKALAAAPSDLLLTDISMPGGMDGISLAQKARAAHPSLHIVIISGYADFEYARGAIEAAVDDYLLKPVSPTRMTDVMGAIEKKLDTEYAEKRESLLSALIGGQACAKEELARFFGEGNARFAFARFGNLKSNRLPRLHGTSMVRLSVSGFTILHARDENELILIENDVGASSGFPHRLETVLNEVGLASPRTVIFDDAGKSVSALPGFLRDAVQAMDKSVVIGANRLLRLPWVPQEADATRVSPAALKKLGCFVAGANARMVKDMFLSFAAEWEQKMVPQYRAENMTHQIVHQILESSPALFEKQDAVYREMNELFQYAASYGDLLAGLYSVLFEDDSCHDKRASGDELCGYTLKYIRENYSKPLSIQLVCAEVGISQTYLSRLLRKYAGTTFNTYLTKQRIDAAIALIKEHPDILLRDVSECVGYDDQSYFSKIFHQATGLTPKQYAATISGSDDPRDTMEE